MVLQVERFIVGGSGLRRWHIEFLQERAPGLPGLMIIDAHTHLELPISGVAPDPSRTCSTRLLIWSYEALGFHNPLWRGEPPEPARMLMALENQLRLSMGNRKNLLSTMDRNGIDISIVLPVAPFCTSQEYLNACREQPRLIPFASACPAEGWESELQQAMQGGCKGLKLHPILQKTPPEDPFYFNLLEVFRPFSRPVLLHTGEFSYYIVKNGCESYGDTRRFEKLIGAFPDIPFILGHLGLYYPGRAIELACRYKNVYLETSFQPLNVVRKAIDAAGAERVIFGSDWPESDSKYALTVAKKVSRQDKALRENLLGKTILRLIS